MTASSVFQTPYSRVTGSVVGGFVRRRIVSLVDAIESSYTRNLDVPNEIQDVPGTSKYTPN